MLSFPVLGTQVHCATYDSGLEEVKRLAGEPRPAAVSAANTHIVALARADESFGRVMSQFALILPDGYPLVWQLNRRGADLKDRVYGPYFMRHVLQFAPRPWKHFFFGGTQDCLDRLTAAARELQPDIDIVGTISPPYRAWTEDEEADFARQIQDSRADFIWVALGGERQERWIVKNLHRHPRGVFFAVGDAFELLAGSRPFAPEWMQSRGLTWLYRLVQEPRRLWARYFKFNSLFVGYLIRDAILGTPRRNRRHLRIGFLGSRGVPARYSGFEVVVEELGSRLAAQGHQVTVYNRFPRFVAEGRTHKGMRLITLPTIPTKSLDTIVHTSLSVVDALFRRFDLIYLCGVGNSILASPMRKAGLRVIINVDGADFRRAKWGSTGRQWLKISELWATRFADRIIADNGEIVSRYERTYGVTPDFISYGCQIRTDPVRQGELQRWGLEPGGYILHVSRLTPENAADSLLEAWRGYSGPLKLVITGSQQYEKAYYEKLLGLADDRVIFTGARFGAAYVELSQNALFFVMPAAIEATRLVLLDQLAMGKTILYRDSAATREVVGEAAVGFDGPEDFSRKITELAADPERCRRVGEAALERAKWEFSWDAVVAKYERLFDDLFPCRISPSSRRP
ncbi:MAG: WecB/TagA/CpsF family glycosyltransferase [Terrimicrobiaceae bacterium]|nr:WecB/TagA/CpsF family glycosyltransferase [Terrimicrobiaceae bacterium]